MGHLPAEARGWRPRNRSLASKYTYFTGALVLWVVAVLLGLEAQRRDFDLNQGLVIGAMVVLAGTAISRLTVRLLARPLTLLEDGIRSVRGGKLEPIQVSRTGDEIEQLGEAFNGMIAALTESQSEVRQAQELLEQRIRQRTEELELAMQGAVAASHAKSEFLANVSHELRTPMNGVIGMLDVALDSRLNVEQREQLETAQRCAYSLLSLLNDLLDLSKIEAGKMELEKIPFGLRLLVDDCVKGQTALAAKKNLRLDTIITPLLPDQVIGDPLRIRQIVNNLLGNAVKFTESGAVTLRLEADAIGDRMLEVKIEVCDTGPGISPEKMTAIFDKFTQGNGAISRNYGGTGLGLAISKKLVELHGGMMRVESAPGQGSTFTATVLCEMVETKATIEPAGAEAALRAAEPAPDCARILVVEDNLVNQKVVSAILRKRKCVIDIANNGEQAIKILASPDAPLYSLVLMDVQMPVMDGLEATRAIREVPRWRTLPIIAMTAHAMNGDRERCIEAGMNGYISKPVHPAHLLETVDTVLGGDRKLKVQEKAGAGQSGTDHDLVEGMLHLFLELAPERVGKLRAAAERNDAGALAYESYKIMAAADRIGSPAIVEWARRTEDAARREDYTLALDCIARLGDEIGSLEQRSSQPHEAFNGPNTGVEAD